MHFQETKNITLLQEWAKNEFVLDLEDIHGISHWKRVDTFGMILSRLTNADKIVLRCFAYLHDSQRQCEDSDPQHGERAASQIANLVKNGILKGLTPSQLNLLEEACQKHTHGKNHPDPTIGACWDSDRLDLPRTGIEISPQYFSTEPGKTLCQGLSEEKSQIRILLNNLCENTKAPIFYQTAHIKVPYQRIGNLWFNGKETLPPTKVPTEVLLSQCRNTLIPL